MSKFQNATLETVQNLVSKLPRVQYVDNWSSLNVIKARAGGYVEIWAGGTRPICKGSYQSVCSQIQEYLNNLEH